MDAFLLIGQSNMAGRGVIGSVPPIDPRGMMFMLRNGRWVPMSEPINPDRQIFVEKDTDYRSGVSLAASFAESYANRFGQKVGLIPCADGGTSLSEWQPDSVLFDHAVFQTRLAMRSSELKGILWHQGENDSRDMADVNAYPDRFFAMLDELIARIGAPESIPVVVGEVSELMAARWPYVREMNRALNGIASARENIGFAKQDGLTIGPDGIHFSGPSYREFGRRYFDAYEKLRRES